MIIQILFMPLLVFALAGCHSTGPVQPPLATQAVPGNPIQTFETIAPRDLYHEVGPLETLWRISQMYEVDQKAIMEANGLKDPSSLAVGRKLLIPAAQPLRPIIPLYGTRAWFYIVIHHTATEQGKALAIDRSHQRRGFVDGMGYHFLIDNGTLGKNMGQIEVGPRWIRQENGAHANAAGMNERGIGIALVGNFSANPLPEAQLESLVFLVNALRNHYGIPLSNVIGHRDVRGKNTECPGNYFPWEEFKRRLPRGV